MARIGARPQGGHESPHPLENNERDRNQAEPTNRLEHQPCPGFPTAETNGADDHDNPQKKTTETRKNERPSHKNRRPRVAQNETPKLQRRAGYQD